MYKDILNTPYPNPETEKSFPHKVNRSAQFAPYAALVGFEDKVKETARLTERKIEQDEGIVEELNRKIGYIENTNYSDEVAITYFKADRLKSGGEYLTHQGFVMKVREYEKEIIFCDGTTIPMEDILNIEIKNSEI